MTPSEPAHALAALQFAIQTYQAGDLDRGERLLRDVLAKDSDNPEALKFLGKLLLERGAFAQAAQILSQARAAKPGSVTILIDLGMALGALQRPTEALACYDDAIARRPDLALAYYNRAAPLCELGRQEDALADYDKAIALQPQFPPAHLNRGVTLEGLGRLEEALAGLDRAIALKPDFADAHYNRGNMLKALERPQEALASYDRAIALQPRFASAHTNRAALLESLGRLDDAMAAHDQAIALNPGLAKAHLNRGNSLRELGRIDEAIASYDRALTAHPPAPASLNRAYCQLLLGDFRHGQPGYECRPSNAGAGLDPARRLTPQTLGDVAGKKVWVRYEIGLGDTIHYCRYLAALARRGAILLLSVQPALRALIGTLDVPFTLIDDGVPAHDTWVNIVSLEYLLQDDEAASTVPYLKPDPARVTRWQSRLGQDGFKIAVSWQGAARQEIFPRGFPPAQLARIAALPSVRLISVNKGGTGAGIENPGPDFDAGPDGFLDTAAVIAACDLVISCDTAVAHLAGALGAPTWVALKQIPDCRWLLNRADTPIYPTMTLFRQQMRGAWDSVFEAMEARLCSILDSH